MNPAPGTVLRRAGDTRYRILDGEAVVVRQSSGEVLGLDAVGTRLLELLDGKRPLSALISALEREYEVGHEELERDVLAFAAELVECGVAEPVPAGEP